MRPWVGCLVFFDELCSVVVGALTTARQNSNSLTSRVDCIRGWATKSYIVPVGEGFAQLFVIWEQSERATVHLDELES